VAVLAKFTACTGCYFILLAPKEQSNTDRICLPFYHSHVHLSKKHNCQHTIFSALLEIINLRQFFRDIPVNFENAAFVSK